MWLPVFFNQDEDSQEFSSVCLTLYLQSIWGLLNWFDFPSFRVLKKKFSLKLSSESNPQGSSSSHEHSTDGADGPVQDHSLGGGELPGKALWVHAGVPEHHGEGIQQDPLHQGWEWTVSWPCCCSFGSLDHDIFSSAYMIPYMITFTFWPSVFCPFLSLLQC